MTGSPRRHRSYWAFVGHRLSGVALALFLPLHFLVLGLALESAAALDEFLVLAEMPLFKAAEWGLVVLLSIHLFFGLRLLALELLPWRDDAREGWITAGIGAAVLAGGAFLLGA
ncbi:MAG: succinate dehydrogenase, partial [Dichotomicrobium sp.]